MRLLLINLLFFLVACGGARPSLVQESQDTLEQEEKFEDESLYIAEEEQIIELKKELKQLKSHLKHQKHHQVSTRDVQDLRVAIVNMEAKIASLEGSQDEPLEDRDFVKSCKTVFENEMDFSVAYDFSRVVVSRKDTIMVEIPYLSKGEEAILTCSCDEQAQCELKEL